MLVNQQHIWSGCGESNSVCLTPSQACYRNTSSRRRWPCALPYLFDTKRGSHQPRFMHESWPPHQESNPDLPLRRGPHLPLYDGEIGGKISTRLLLACYLCTTAAEAAARTRTWKSRSKFCCVTNYTTGQRSLLLIGNKVFPQQLSV